VAAGADSVQVVEAGALIWTLDGDLSLAEADIVALAELTAGCGQRFRVFGPDAYSGTGNGGYRGMQRLPLCALRRASCLRRRRSWRHRLWRPRAFATEPEKHIARWRSRKAGFALMSFGRRTSARGSRRRRWNRGHPPSSTWSRRWPWRPSPAAPSPSGLCSFWNCWRLS